MLLRVNCNLNSPLDPPSSPQCSNDHEDFFAVNIQKFAPCIIYFFDWNESLCVPVIKTINNFLQFHCIFAREGDKIIGFHIVTIFENLKNSLKVFNMWFFCFVFKLFYSLHMVKSHEDAYCPDSFSLFSVSCEHYREPKKQNYRENWLLWFICMSGECCRIIFVLQGVRKNCQNCPFWSPL